MDKKVLTFKQFLNEADYYTGENPGAADANQMYEPQHQHKETAKQRRKREQEEALEKLKPQSLHGFKPSEEHSADIVALLQQHTDDPDTAQIEMPEKGDWQSINTAAQNAIQRQIQQMKLQQGMRI